MRADPCVLAGAKTFTDTKVEKIKEKRGSS
jgi:hypothetical protein